VFSDIVLYCLQHTTFLFLLGSERTSPGSQPHHILSSFSLWHQLKPISDLFCSVFCCLLKLMKILNCLHARVSEVVSAGRHGIKCAVSPGRVTSEKWVPEQTGLVTSPDSPAYKGFLNIFVETQHWTWPASPSCSYGSNHTCSLWLHRLPAVLHSWDPSLGR